MADAEQRPARERVGRRLALWTGVVSLLGLALVFAVVIPLERAAIERARVARVSLLAETVATGYDVVDEAKRNHPSRALLAQAARTEDVAFIEVTDHTGAVKRATVPTSLGKTHTLPTGLRDSHVEGEHLVVSYNIPWTRSCVGCHESSADPVGAVRVGVQPKGGISAIERFHLYAGLALILLLLAVGIAINVLADRFVTRPLKALARVMRKAERGDVLVRARVDREDEVGALGTAFNEMLRAMTDMKATEIEREADLAAARHELEFKAQIEDFAAKLKASNDELEDRVRAQGLLMEAAHRFGSTLHLDELSKRLADLIAEQLEWADFAIFLVEPGQEGEPVLACAHAGGRADTEEMRAVRFRVGEGVTGFVADTGAPFTAPDLSDDALKPAVPLKDGPLKSGALLAVPMLHKGTVVGVLDFFADDPNAIDEDLLALLQALAAQAAMAVVNAQLYEATHELSVTDPLTNLMNRRALERRLDVEITRAKRFGHPLALLMIDVDHFKKYNDRMGHLLGDDALRAVARALKTNTRAVDSVARYGGEEFSVLLPRTSREDAEEVADKLCAAVRDLELKGAADQPLGKMSISVGLAVFPLNMPPVFEGSAGAALTGRADEALYGAKDQGRDRVVVAEGTLKKDRVLAPEAEITPVAPARDRKTLE
jgi:diguanylate cyclase (GGDEF)-like protein